MSQKIVGNFVVGAVYSSNEIGQWTGIWLVRRYGVNNGRIMALKAAPGLFKTGAEAAERALELGEEFARALDPDSGDASMTAADQELFIPPTASTQRTESTL